MLLFLGVKFIFIFEERSWRDVKKESANYPYVRSFPRHTINAKNTKKRNARVTHGSNYRLDLHFFMQAFFF